MPPSAMNVFATAKNQMMADATYIRIILMGIGRMPMPSPDCREISISPMDLSSVSGIL